MNLSYDEEPMPDVQLGSTGLTGGFRVVCRVAGMKRQTSGDLALG